MSLSSPISSAWTAGTTANTPTIPTHQAGDLLVFVVHAKPTSTGTPPTFSTPTDWTACATGTDGSGTAQAVDLGQTWSASFFRVATASNHGNPTCTVTNGNTNLGCIYRFRKTDTTGGWSLSTVYAADSTAGTDYSVTGTQTTRVNDQIMVSSGLSGNNVNYNATWTRSGGGTSGSVTKLPTSDGSTNGGNDCAASSAWAAMTAASASPFAMTWANTLSGNQKGGAILIRVGEAFTVSTDPVGITDAISYQHTLGNVDHTFTRTDPEGITDSQSVAVAYVRSATDPVGVTDAIIAGLDLSVATTDPVGLTDAITVIQTHARTATDPVGVYDANYLLLPNSGTAYARTLDHSSFDIGGDIDFRALIDPTDWTPGAAMALIHRDTTLANANVSSYSWTILTGGFLAINWSDGTTHKSITATQVIPGGSVGTPLWVRSTLDVDNGSGQHVASFYTSTNGTDWTEFNSVTGSGTTQINTACTNNIHVGRNIFGSGTIFDGRIYRAQLRDGIDGTVVINPVFNRHPGAAAQVPGWFDTTGRAWTLQGTAEIAGPFNWVTDSVRTQTDPVGLLDALVLVADYARSATDPVEITDAVTVEFTHARTITDAVGVTDTLAVTASYVRDRTDPVGLTDAITVIQTHVRTVTDSVGLTDSITVVTSSIRTLTDPVGLDDSGVYILSLRSDPIGLTDAAAQVHTAVRSQTDPLGILDAAARAQASDRTFTDPLGLLDAATRVADAVRPLTDALGLVDAATYDHTIGGTDHTRTIDDPIGLLDAASSVATYVATKTDTLGLSDAVSWIQDSARSLTDVVGVLDSLALAAVYARTATDPVGILDAVTVLLVKDLTFTDPVGVTDSGVYILSLRSDPVGLTDAIIVVQTSARTLTDPIGITDVIAVDQSGTASRTITDPVGITDSRTRAATYVRSATDPVGLTDAIIVVQTSARTLTDPIGIIDPLTRTHSAIRTLIDPVGLLDSIARSHSAARAIVDPVGVDDLHAVAITVTEADAVGISDSVTVDLISGRVITDSVGISDPTHTEAFGSGYHTSPISLTDAILVRLYVEPIDPYERTYVICNEGVYVLDGRARYRVTNRTTNRSLR